MTVLRTCVLAALLLTALAIPMAARAAPHASINDAKELPAVKVTATLPAIQLDRPGTTSVIDRQQMNRHLVTDIRALVRYEPGVSAIGDGGRYGLDSFNIRGLSGNRTYMAIDGVPMARSFGAGIAGGSVRAGRNFIDLDTIKRVKIIRGPASALVPSSALGGAVLLMTKDPADYIEPGEQTFASVKELVHSADRSFSTSATLAAGDQRNGFLLTANHRQGHETDSTGDVGGIGASRTRPDPKAYRADGVLGKYVHTAAGGRSDRLTVAATRRHMRSNGLSQLVSNPHTGFVPDDYRSQDTSTRARASIGQRFAQLDAAVADRLDWHLYWQRSRTRNHTQTDTPAIKRYFSTEPLQAEVLGGKLLAVKPVGGVTGIAQTIRYGAAVSRSSAQSLVDGYGVNKQTGEIGKSKDFMPGDYPLHLFPRSDTDRYALFAQDEMALLDGDLVVTPGVRVERYEYRPQADALYQAYNPGYQQRDYSASNVAPKLGAIWHFNDVFSVHADYAFGFRPPLYSELSGAWNEQPVPGFSLAFLPSPNLAAETSRNAELGLRGQGRAGWFSVGGYINRYRNFIWSGYALAPDEVPDWAHQIAPGAGYSLYFQAANAPRAVIKGLEASGRLRLGALNEALRGWSLHAAAAMARGKLIEPGDTAYSPLNTVDPAKLVVGVGYNAADWGAELIGTAVRRHPRLSDPAIFRPGGYGTLDFYVHYAPNRHLKLAFGVRNLGDRKYWDWGSLNGGMLGNLVSGNGVNDAGTGGVPADRLSMPGRNFSASARISF